MYWYSTRDFTVFKSNILPACIPYIDSGLWQSSLSFLEPSSTSTYKTTEFVCLYYMCVHGITCMGKALLFLGHKYYDVTDKGMVQTKLTAQVHDNSIWSLICWKKTLSNQRGTRNSGNDPWLHSITNWRRNLILWQRPLNQNGKLNLS